MLFRWHPAKCLKKDVEAIGQKAAGIIADDMGIAASEADVAVLASMTEMEHRDARDVAVA